MHTQEFKGYHGGYQPFLTINNDSKIIINPLHCRLLCKYCMFIICQMLILKWPVLTIYLNHVQNCIHRGMLFVLLLNKLIDITVKRGF